MPPKPPRRAVTLSISLTPELAREVAERVASGLYTSSSELIREALRLLLRAEGARSAPLLLGADEARSTPAGRFREASDLMDLGLALRAEKLRRSEPELSEVERRLTELAEEQETGPGLRSAPERLQELRRDGPG